MASTPVDRPAPEMALLPGALLPLALGVSAFVLGAMLLRDRLGIDCQSYGDRLLVLAAAGVVAVLLAFRAPRTPAQRIARDLAEYYGLFGGICLVGAAASYPLAEATSSFVDPALAGADRLLRFDWLAWYDMVAAHPALQVGGGIAYQSIFVTPAVLLGWFALTGRKAQARFFIASFALAAFLTLAVFPLAPAEGPLAYLWHGPVPYLPASALYQAEIIPLLRQGALHSIGVTTLHGLVCAPSFHAASAVLYMLAAWPERPLRWPVLLVTGAMLLSTPVEGTHYLTDMLLGAAVAILSNRILCRWLRVQDRAHAFTPEPAPSTFEAFRAMLARLDDRTLIRAFADEPGAGPRAMAMADEIDRRGLAD